MQLLSAGNGYAVAAAGKSHAKGAQGLLRVVARSYRLLNCRLALGKQASKDNCRLHLRAGHRHFVINAMKPAAMDLERRAIALRRAHLRSHLPQWVNDPRHGPA